MSQSISNQEVRSPRAIAKARRRARAARLVKTLNLSTRQKEREKDRQFRKAVRKAKERIARAIENGFQQATSGN